MRGRCLNALVACALINGVAVAGEIRTPPLPVAAAVRVAAGSASRRAGGAGASCCGGA